MLAWLAGLCSMPVMAVFACVGGVLPGTGFLLFKLEDPLLGILAGCLVLMEAAWDWVLHLMGA